MNHKKHNQYIDHIITGLTASMLVTTIGYMLDITNEKCTKSLAKTEQLINTLKLIKKTRTSYDECKKLVTMFILDLKLGL